MSEVGKSYRAPSTHVNVPFCAAASAVQVRMICFQESCRGHNLPPFMMLVSNVTIRKIMQTTTEVGSSARSI